MTSLATVVGLWLWFELLKLAAGDYDLLLVVQLYRWAVRQRGAHLA